MSVTPIVPEISLSRLKTVCSTCSLRELCLPVGLSQQDMTKLDDLVFVRRTVKRGEHLFRAGDPFDSLYAPRTGFFKTKLLLEDGREQVTGFHMAGELMGLDGIGPERHTCDAVALEDSDVCVIPFERLEGLSREMEALQHHFHKVMSREIVREHGVMMLLGSMRAEERPGRIPAQPVSAVEHTRLLRARVQPAHDTRRDRQLSRG